LNEIVSYIAEDSEQNATLVGDRIERTANRLADFPIGRFGRVENTYEIVVARTSYIIAYEKSETTIVILRVIHGARDWQEGAWPADD
jgi:plasmid stabilization system protein ParE